jgi:hypothetical protein
MRGGGFFAVSAHVASAPSRAGYFLQGGIFEMKSKHWVLWMFLFAAMFAFMTGGCGGGGGGNGSDGPSPAPGGEKLTVTPSKLPLAVGGTAGLTATNYEGSLKWQSEDESVATVTGSGATVTVTAVGVGTTNIVVFDDSSAEATCVVTVTKSAEERVIEIPEDHVVLEGVTFNPNIQHLTEDEIASVSYSSEAEALSFSKKSGVSIKAAASSVRFPNYVEIRGKRGYQPGHVLVCPPTENTPHEYAVVIDSVESLSNGNDRCAVNQVCIDDVITDGNVFLSAGAHPSYALQAARRAGKNSGNDIEDLWEFIKTGANAPALFNDPIIDFNLSTVGSPALKAEFLKYLGAEVEADFNMMSKLDIEILTSVKNNVTERAAMVFPGQIKIGAEFKVKSLLRKKFDEIKLTGLPLIGVWLNVGPIPVYINIDLVPVAQFEAGVSAKLSSKAELGLSGMFGFYYENNEVKNIPFSPELETDGSTTLESEIEGYAKLFAGAKITCKGYKLLEAFSIKAGPTLKGSVNTKERAVLLELEGKVTAAVDILNVFKKVPNLTGLKTELTLWELNPPKELKRIPFTSNPNPTPDTGNWIDVADTSWYSPYKTEFTISTDVQLAGLAKLVNETSAVHDNFYGKTIRLVSDINLAGREWTPIGLSTYSFSSSCFGGTFDGGGHTISNLTITGDQGERRRFGLFGNSEGGEIKNVHLTDVSINVSSSSPGDAYAGGLVGWNYGMITDCTASGDVSSSSNSYGSHAGGLVGFNGGTITDCTTSGDVSSSSSTSSSSYAGGLVGYNNVRGMITNCTASGDVSTTTTTSSSCAGGLVGYNGGTITGCTASGDASSTSSYSSSYTGGLVGYNGGTITDCTASGDVSSSSSSSSSSSCAGGLVGLNSGMITGCTASGDVSSSSTTSSSYYASCAGGLVGRNNGGTITDCTASGKVIEAYAEGGTAYRGGFIGSLYEGTLTGKNKNETGLTPAIGWDMRLTPYAPSDDI